MNFSTIQVYEKFVITVSILDYTVETFVPKVFVKRTQQSHWMNLFYDFVDEALFGIASSAA